MTVIPAEADNVPATSLDLDGLHDELMWAIGDAITNHPRSLQKRIGPSELGHPCGRRIAYKLLGHPERARDDVAWYPTIGTAMHTWLEGVFGQLNDKLGIDDRFLLEQKVNVGDILGDPVTGSCDLYDAVTFTVIDWKIVGGDRLKKYRDNGPGDQYRTQAHLYGRGWTRQGRRVDHVAVMFLPRDRMLNKAYFWHEPYDEQVALAALDRVEGITKLTRAAGTAALPLLPTADAWCRYCPYFKAGSSNPAEACPGDPGATAPSNSLTSLIA